MSGDAVMFYVDAAGYVTHGDFQPAGQHPKSGYHVIGTSVIPDADIVWPNGERWTWDHIAQELPEPTAPKDTP